MAIIEDLLPYITIKPDISPNDFILKMIKIAKSSYGIAYIKNESSGESALSLSITFKNVKQHGLDNLYGSFAVCPWDTERVLVELLSTTWAISPPSYNRYVEYINCFLGPFLKQYNKQFQTRRRFCIPRKEQLEPKLSPVIRKVFDRFVKSANKSLLSQRDWRNFYSLIRVCHNRKAKLIAEDLERLFLKAGFSKYYADKLSCIYEHGRGILRKEYYPEHIQKMILSDEYIEKRRHITKQMQPTAKNRVG